MSIIDTPDISGVKTDIRSHPARKTVRWSDAAALRPTTIGGRVRPERTVEKINDSKTEQPQPAPQRDDRAYQCDGNGEQAKPGELANRRSDVPLMGDPPPQQSRQRPHVGQVGSDVHADEHGED